MQPIRSATVIGSGIMGSQIAAHLAGCGIPVLLLDILTEGRQRNAIAERGRDSLKKAKPSPLYSAEALDLIKVGNTVDHLVDAGKTDWILEAIVEKPGPKQELFQKLQAVMGPTTLLSTNTSGIPLKILGQELSNSVQERFIGTHFFNPPRYLRLVEVIRGPKTSQTTVDRIHHLLTAVLNKVAVPALDSPAFIANRIGVHAMFTTLEIAKDMNLTVEEVDFLTGPLLGRPKTGTFRLADLVGLDTLGHILKGLHQAFPTEGFSIDPILQTLIDHGTLGKKSGAGFYRKAGKEALEVVDLTTGNYQPEVKANFDALKSLAKEESLEKKFSQLFKNPDQAPGQALGQDQIRGLEAARRILSVTIAYAATVAPSITEELSYIDEAMEFGFGWDAGPFKILDAIGIEAFKATCFQYKIPCPAWLLETSDGDSRIYKQNGGLLEIKPVPQLSNNTFSKNSARNQVKPRGFSLAMLRAGSKPLLSSLDATLWNMGDDILLLEFHSKMNTMGPVSLAMIIRAVEKANEMAAGLVIGNQGPHFCAGANIAMVLMDAMAQDFGKIDFAISQFQKASMAIKYSGVPVIVAPHNSALGGGCEFVIHCNRPVLSPETYTGLVEVGVGILPAGGGTKELTIRAMDRSNGMQALSSLLKYFELIVKGKVSMSAKEAIDMGYLDRRAVIASNESTRLDQAKAEAMAMSLAGYRPPAPAKRVEVLGTEALASFESAIYMLQEAGYATSHDALIARGVGHIMAGGTVTAGSIVDEDYLLELEREEFLKLVGTKKTQERMDFMLKKGKPLRN